MSFVFLRCACGHVSDIKLLLPRLVALTGYPNVEYTCDTCWRTENRQRCDAQGEVRSVQGSTTIARVARSVPD